MKTYVVINIHSGIVQEGTSKKAMTPEEALQENKDFHISGRPFAWVEESRIVDGVAGSWQEFFYGTKT